MTVTVSYSYNNVKPEFSAPFDTSSNGNDGNPSLVALSNGNFYLASQWQSLATPANTSITGELFNGSGTEIAAYGLAGSTTGVTNSDPSVTQLTNGNVLTTWTGPDGIHYALNSPSDNSYVKTDALLPGTTGEFASDVAALRNGGFAVVTQYSASASNQNSYLHIYTANGTQTSFQALAHNVGDEKHPAVAVLNNGNIAVAYELANGIGGFYISVEIFKPDGTTGIGSPLIFDSGYMPDIVALKDGGFAVAYQNNVYTGIVVAFLDSDGALRGTRVVYSNGIDLVSDPSITVLANGNIAVTATPGGIVGPNIGGALFDPSTMQWLGFTAGIETQAGAQTQSSIIGLADGTHVVAWTDANSTLTDGNTDPNGTHVSVQIDAWTRNTTGISDNETFRGDGLRDVFTSGGGANTFVYGRGGHADIINGFVPGAASYDQIVLSGFSGVRSFADVMLRASQIGADTVLSFGNGDTLTLTGVNKSSLTAGDFDIKAFDGNVSLYPSFGSDMSAGGWPSQNLTPRMMADVNGDGRADIVGFGESATYVSLAKATGGFSDVAVGINSFGFSAAGGGWANNDTFHRTLGDVNGDGKADIVGFGNSGVYVSLATGNGQFADPSLKLNQFGTDPSAGGWASDDTFPRMVADVNGDGRDDIIGFAGDGVWVALTSPSHTIFALPQMTLGTPFLSLASFGADASAGGWTSDTQYHREMADVNGDGMADIVGFGSSATYVSLATGGGHFADPKIAIDSFGYAPEGGGWFTQDQYPRHLADVNGDGRADIVGFGDSTTYISYGNADGTFGDPIADLASFGRSAVAGGWASDSTLPRMLADVDGNGAADIVGFGNGGVYVAHSNVNWLG